MVVLLTTSAAATPTTFTTPVTCEAPNGATIDLDPGRYIPEDQWLDLDSEIKRLQDSETRLTAENKELQKPDPTPWKLVLGATLLGIAAGAYAFKD